MVPGSLSGLESVARAAHATSAPASASASAIARPTPRLAPVTKAAAPCSSIAVAYHGRAAPPRLRPDGSVTRDCGAGRRGHRLRFDSAPLDTGPGATDPCGA